MIRSGLGGRDGIAIALRGMGRIVMSSLMGEGEEVSCPLPAPAAFDPDFWLFCCCASVICSSPSASFVVVLGVGDGEGEGLPRALLKLVPLRFGEVLRAEAAEGVGDADGAGLMSTSSSSSSSLSETGRLPPRELAGLA